MLKNLAALLIGRVRVTDVPCRYGGEEFLLLLPGMAPDIAMLRANTWRTAFAEMSSTLDGVTIKATMSIGVAIYPEHGDTITELTHCADLALYRAKEEGRNRAIMYTEELAKAKS